MAAQKPAAKPAPEAPETPEVAQTPEPEAASEAKTVTPADDLRVVTKDLVVLTLKAGEPRKLAPEIAFEAQRCAAEQEIELTVE